MLQKTRAVVLKTQDYGETHKLITLFTYQFGKITAIGRGANKPKSRLNAISQLFIEGELLIYVSQKGLSTLNQGTILQSFRYIREDLERTAYAAYVVELTDRLLDERKADAELYVELIHTLEWINERDLFEIPVMMYELKLFRKGGFAPVVHYCVHCETKEGPFTFSIFEGGTLCLRCSKGDPHTITVDQAIIRLLQIFLDIPLRQVGNINVKRQNIQTLRAILNHYYERYGGYFLKSKKFLNSLHRLDK